MQLLVLMGLKTRKYVEISRLIIFTTKIIHVIMCKTLHILSHIQLISNMLPWKRNQLLHGRPLLVAEYRTTMKSV
jgi:hypothetical protein